MNKSLFEDEMKKRGVSKTDMYMALGISRSAFYRKCNGISEFTQSEIQKIIDVFGIESPVDIFFSQKVS